MQINSLKTDKTKFTSVIPVKVFINGNIETDPNIIRKAIINTCSIIKAPQNSIYKEFAIAHNFPKHVPDFQNAKIYGGGELKNYVDNSVAYLFSGMHNIDFSNQKNVIKKSKNYFELMNKYISNMVGKLTEFIPNNGSFVQGKPLKMIINANKNGKYVSIQNIAFEPLETVHYKQLDLFQKSA